MVALIDLTGRTFGFLTVMSRAENSAAGKARWLCRCTCGAQATVVGSALSNGSVKSCGRHKATDAAIRFRKHGQSGTRTYQAWSNMRRRCTDPSIRQYKDYGGRGITVCERWDSFPNFLSDMGEVPVGTSLDRINNDGNYEPGNCRWATRIQQSHNSRRPRLFTIGDVTDSINGWAKRTGIDTVTILERLERGWPTEEALTAKATNRWQRAKKFQ